MRLRELFRCIEERIGKGDGCFHNTSITFVILYVKVAQDLFALIKISRKAMRPCLHEILYNVLL